MRINYPACPYQRGATLLSVLAGLTLVLILISIAVPSLQELLSTQARGASSRQLLLDIRRARTEALAAGGRGIINVDSSGTFYSFGIDRPPYSASAAADQLMFLRRLELGVTLSTSQSIIFDSRGILVDGSGTISSAEFSLLQRGQAFADGNIYSTGYVEL